VAGYRTAQGLGYSSQRLIRATRLVHNPAVNGAAPKIEIFKPFGEAFELTKKILFQPFDLKKWCVIGFAVFLMSLTGFGFPGFHFPGGGSWTNHVSTSRDDFRSVINQLGPIWLTLIVVAFFVVIAIFVVLTWIRSRGHFIFIDCIVRNRGAIVQPWNEYSAEGNSYFVFLLVATLALLAVVAAFIVLLLGGMLLLNHRAHHGVASVLSLVLVGIGLVLLLSLFGLLIHFVAPVMYRRRCKAWPAFVDLVSLLGKHVGVFVLYFLFSIVVGIGIALAVFVVICATCCIAAIPYVGTVILLPIFVFMQSFSLLFLRQFGPDYDVWAGVAPLETPATLLPPPIPPPIQT
jgi:hypothetical protein